MGTIFNKIMSELIFWMAWIIIPLVVEIIPALGGFFILLKKRIFQKKPPLVEKYPEITLIIPVFNSNETLEECLKSVYESDYDASLISIILANNMSSDNSFEVFNKCQTAFPDLSMQWLNSKQGKSKALNMALFNSNGKYIIHIDSDGRLEKSAIKNMVTKFEQNSNIHCMTGAVLTDPNEIEATENPFVKLFRKTEFFEYCQAFLAGRNFESELDSIYTLSGAFSGFRKSTILKTQLYNTGTVCEDTHVTFQIRRILDKKVNICENSLYFVNPIENFDKLYTQRQRWQRGEIEVSHMFVEKKRKDSRGIFPNLLTKILMLDHTFAFPRMIWYFALICLAFMNYPIKLIVGSVVIIYLLYVISSFLYYVNICMYLKDFPKFRRYYARKWYLSFLLPLFNFVIFWIRFAGIINCIKSEGTWKTRTFSDEFSDFLKIIKSDFSFVTKLIRKIRKAVNNG